MYKVNDYVMYKKDVCKVREIKNNKLNGNDYYILVPIDDKSLIIDVPVDNRMGFLRNLISKEEADLLIDNIGNIKPLENVDEKNVDKSYRDLLYNGSHEDLIKIIKTAYLRNVDRVKNNKKIREKDKDYFNQAEKYLYNELAIVYEMTSDEIKNYIIQKVQEKNG